MKFSISNSQFAIPPIAIPPHRELARTRLFILLLLAAASLAAALVFLSAARTVATTGISIGVLSYESWGGKGPDLQVRVGITNTGHATIRYNLFNFNGDAWVRTESRNGWTNRDIGPGAGFVWLPALLRPGAETDAIIMLPGGTLRWQVTYKVRAASLRRRVASAIPVKWYPRLFPLCSRFLSDREGPEQECQSPVFECPQNEPLAMRCWTPPAFDPEAPPWIVPAPQSRP